SGACEGGPSRSALANGAGVSGPLPDGVHTQQQQLQLQMQLHQLHHEQSQQHPQWCQVNGFGFAASQASTNWGASFSLGVTQMTRWQPLPTELLGGSSSERPGCWGLAVERVLEQQQEAIYRLSVEVQAMRQIREADGAPAEPLPGPKPLLKVPGSSPALVPPELGSPRGTKVAHGAPVMGLPHNLASGRAGECGVGGSTLPAHHYVTVGAPQRISSAQFAATSQLDFAGDGNGPATPPQPLEFAGLAEGPSPYSVAPNQVVTGFTVPSWEYYPVHGMTALPPPIAQGMTPPLSPDIGDFVQVNASTVRILRSSVPESTGNQVGVVWDE
ncbi:unnamed protein product, partial [Polarella glacialis]